MKPGCDANYFSGGSFILNTISIENIQKWQSAGLWIRIQAFVMDYLVILVYLALLTALVWTLNSVFPNISKALFDNPLSGQITVTVVLTMPVTLYFALFELSGWQATLGKRWKNLKVVYASGGRLSRTRAVFRTLLKFIPWELAHTCMWQISICSSRAITNDHSRICLGMDTCWCKYYKPADQSNSSSAI